MAITNPEPWRVKDYASVPQDDDLGEVFSEPYQVPGKVDNEGNHSADPLQENSSLLSAKPTDDDDADSAPGDSAHDSIEYDGEEKSKSAFYLFLLTVSIGG
jgi:hypothetical protein